MSYPTKTYCWNKLSITKLLHDDAHVQVNDDIMGWLSSIDIKGKNVIDGGSNIGVMSLVFSKMIGNRGAVYAFEIQPAIRYYAIVNATANKRKNISHYNLALSDKSGERVGFTHIDYSQENISSLGVKTEPELRGQPHCGEIETAALDDMNILNVGLIKLDLEGNEPKALNGMWGTIDKYKPYLLIELSPGYLGEDVPKIVEQIKSHGYEVKELTDCNFVFEPA